MNGGSYYIYMLTNKKNKMIRVDMISDQERMVYENQNLIKDFSKKHKINKLVYYETAADVGTAIKREKEIREFKREEKNKLVETVNPKWIDLMSRLIK
jgi:putative endonuclease